MYDHLSAYWPCAPALHAFILLDGRNYSLADMNGDLRISMVWKSRNPRSQPNNVGKDG
jgi:hypothetical protein